LPTGQYQTVTTTRRPSPATARDPRLARPMPWNFLVRHDLTGPQRVMGLLFGGWLLGLPGRSLQGLAMLFVLALLVAAGWWSWTKRFWKAGAAVVGVVVTAMLLGGILPGALRNPWFLPLFRACNVLFGALPLLIFCIACAEAATRLRWRRLGLLLGGAALLALAMSAAWLILDLPLRQSGEYYDWGGWYLAAVAGAGLTGSLILLSSLGRAIWHVSKRLPRPASAPAPGVPAA
jgi:hypothetical protein